MPFIKGKNALFYVKLPFFLMAPARPYSSLSPLLAVFLLENKLSGLPNIETLNMIKGTHEWKWKT